MKIGTEANGLFHFQTCVTLKFLSSIKHILTHPMINQRNVNKNIWRSLMWHLQYSMYVRDRLKIAPFLLSSVINWHFLASQSFPRFNAKSHLKRTNLFSRLLMKLNNMKKKKEMSWTFVYLLLKCSLNTSQQRTLTSF